MSGIASAALILSLALVVLPGSPRCRLTPDDTGRRVLLVGARRVAWGVGCVAVGVAALLPLPTVVAVAVLGATLGLRYRRRRRYLRRSREGQALEAALELVVGELRAGAHPVRAFSIAADETGGPVAVALRAVAARARLGADVTAGLLAAARSSALPAYWERLAVCWQLGSDHGLAIASLMRAAQRDVAERQRFSARVSAGMAGARASAAILAILPLLGVLLGQLIGARPLSFLLTGRVGGWLLVGRADTGLRRAAVVGPDHRSASVVSAAAVLLAMALWLGAGPSVVRARAGRPPRAHRPHQGLLLGRTDVADPLAVAASLDVLAVCLAAGMAVSTAAAATAAVAPPRLARVLRRAADLLALGADPNIAWSRPPDLPPGTHDAQTDAVLRLARRSAASGAALADGIVELAVQVRHDAAQAAAAAAERAGVLIAGPLGLCFLPAFLCVGIVPLVVGLAGDVLQFGLV